MTRQEMIDYILMANKAGVSGRKIEPERNGRTVTDLKRNHDVKCSDEKIHGMYENARRLMNGVASDAKSNAKRERQRVKRVETKPTRLEAEQPKPGIEIERSLILQEVLELRQKIASFAAVLQSIEAENAILKARLEQVEQKHRDVGYTKKERQNDSKILGFRFRQASKVSNGRKYIVWYAMRRIAGKNRKVYLGNSTEGARGKILAWLDKYPGLKRIVEKEEGILLN